MRQLYIILCIATVCMACDPFSNARHGMVSFSTDTIYFDTVFSTIGSVTREFRAINRNKEFLLIDHIYLGGGITSPFRLNINGEPGVEVSDIVLASDDSIFVFVDVNIDPNGDTSPVAVIDSVVFESGGNIMRVILEAWGQDIWLLENEVIGNVTWSEGKPYVVFGSLFVDTATTLTLGAGTRVFFHHDAIMTIAGTLVAEGTTEKPVLLSSDRIFPEYEDIPGQWKGLVFHDCSSNNIVTDTELRNAVTGITIQAGDGGEPDLKIINAKLMHNSVGSLVASGADVLSVNSLFAHSGFSTVSLSGGGLYAFIHCTIANRWEYGYRSAPAFFISKGDGTLPEARIINSVITGSLDNELMVEALSGELTGKVLADSSLVKVDTLSCPWWNRSLFTGVNTTGDPLFIEEGRYDYRPDTLSPLVDHAGKTEALIWPYDIRHKDRHSGEAPDIGAFERQPGEVKEK